MDPHAVLAQAQDALGVERTRAQEALEASRKRKRAPAQPATRKRQPVEAEADRMRVRATWRGFVFSVAYSALHPKKSERPLGPKEKKAVQTMVKQRSWVSAAVRARWLTLGSPGQVFARTIAAHYDKSVIGVKVELGGSSGEATPSCELHCAISKQPIGASAARRVLIRYRGIGGVVRDATPLIVDSVWAERISAWFDLVHLDDAIVERASEMLAEVSNDDLVLPKPLIDQWGGMSIPAIAQLVSQEDDAFDRYRRAIAVWLAYPPPSNVWPGWFN